ncbi:hypothetical protein Pan153_10920 [Gimesia panareensis]|uniref:Uncharacterized protein n=1 Tax=Gimesia panareensis TaxID=2527978 RepID=A0A518FJJ6_9PLAN|nr:hypothetical protein Pan153_10920 [Gimesia panareensis]
MLLRQKAGFERIRGTFVACISSRFQTEAVTTVSPLKCIPYSEKELM